MRVGLRYIQELETILSEYSGQVNQYTIYIPSKDRATSATTNLLLDKLGVTNYMFVVEPQDEDIYRQTYPTKKFLVLDKNNQGIYYVRNFIKNHSKSLGEEYHWQVDDDITRFFFRLTTAVKKTPVKTAIPFWVAEQFVNKYDNIGICGFKNDVFEFNKTQPLAMNIQIVSVMLIKTNTDCWFHNDVIEDTDFNLQLLYNQYTSMELRCFSFAAPPQMRQKGGNTVAFINGLLLKRQKGLAEKYKGYFNFKIVNGNEILKPSKIWKQFKQIPLPK